MRGGDIDSSVLSSNLVYETGALLCQVMDVVGPSDWQTQLIVRRKVVRQHCLK